MRPGAGGVAYEQARERAGQCANFAAARTGATSALSYEKGVVFNFFYKGAGTFSACKKGGSGFGLGGQRGRHHFEVASQSTLAHLHRSILSRIHRLRFTDSRSLFCASRQTSGAKPSISRSFQNFPQPAASAVESWLESAWSQHTGAALCPCRDVRFVRTARLDSPNFCLAGERAR